jgi:hypothetical protein
LEKMRGYCRSCACHLQLCARGARRDRRSRITTLSMIKSDPSDQHLNDICLVRARRWAVHRHIFGHGGYGVGSEYGGLDQKADPSPQPHPWSMTRCSRDRELMARRHSVHPAPLRFYTVSYCTPCRSCPRDGVRIILPASSIIDARCDRGASRVMAAGRVVLPPAAYRPAQRCRPPSARSPQCSNRPADRRRPGRA